MKYSFSKCGLALSLALAAGLVAPSVHANTDDVAPIPVTLTPPTGDTGTQESPTPILSSTEKSQADLADPLVTAPQEGQEVDVRILATTDLHTNLVNYDYYQDKPVETLGLAKTAVLIEEAKKENPNVILVDNGDTIQGTPLGNYKSIVNPIKDGEQHPMYAALESLGFDAGTLGNHEFNYGLDYLDKVIRTANIPLVNANVLKPDTKEFAYTPYIILKKQFTDKNGQTAPLSIGITGIVPPQILSWDKAYLEGKVIVRDAVEAVRDILPTLRQQGADVVLVLSHSGIGDDKYEVGEENVGYQIASLPGVDAVVTGHSHAEFPGTAAKPSFYAKYAGVDDTNGKINGVPVTMAGKYGDHLGVIDLSLVYTDGKWSTTASKAAIRKIDTKSTVADSRVVDLAKVAHEETIAYVRKEVGETTAPINSFFALVQDDPSIQIVNKAQIWYAQKELQGTPDGNLPILSAAAPFKAGTRGDASAYTDIPAGKLAIKNVADLYLYDNVVAILKINGSQLKEWLEMSAGQFNHIDPAKKDPQQLVNTQYRTYNFDVIDGVTYQYDITQPTKYDKDGKILNEQSSRVRNLQYKGVAVQPTDEFIVVTNNYRANGNFPGVREAAKKELLNLENRQAIINYILEEKHINPTADSNWTFTESIKDVDLRFQTADRAKNLLKEGDAIVYLGVSKTEGFGDFRYIYKEVPQVQPETDKQTKPVTHTPKHELETITLSSGTVITLPTVNTDKAPVTRPTTPLLARTTSLPEATAAKTAEVRTATAAPVAATAEQVPAKASEKTLPATGQRQSLLGLVGLALAGLGLPFLTKNKQD